jgi:long-subunit acyl-CoA synthetase (AMP-forming)
MALPRTLVHRLAHWAERQPNAPAIHEKKTDGAWRSYTWGDYWGAVRDTAKGLIALGHQVGECVALIGGSRCGWVISELALQAARGVPAPIYPNNTTEQASYIAKHARARIAIADTMEQLAKYQQGIEQGLMSAAHLILMDEPEAGDERVISLDKLQQLGREQDDTELDKRIADLTTDETALLIYTSGTTGLPKGVQLNHANMVYLCDVMLDCFPLFREEVPFRIVSYLPLCHIAEQIATNFTQLTTGGEVYFCGDMAQIKDYLVEVRPTLFLGVPRVWERFQAVLEGKFAEATGIKSMLAGWARRKELECFEKGLAEGKTLMPLSRRIARKLVISKVHKALGLDQLALAVTGAAPISVGTLTFFASLAIPVYEVYGMSETTGIVTSSHHGEPHFGTVGRVLDRTEVKIADDGEILTRGPGMTCGYLHDPEKTAELFTEDGWLQTGDLGMLDDQGYLKITGRKKDILVTAGGKNIAPAELEQYINQIPGVGQVVVVGDRKPYLSALLTLDPEALDLLCSAVGIPLATQAEVSKNKMVQSYLMDRVEQDCNTKVARYQTIKKIGVLPVELTVEGGEMTPTMKVKRNVITEKYKDEIESLYKGLGKK